MDNAVAAIALSSDAAEMWAVRACRILFAYSSAFAMIIISTTIGIRKNTPPRIGARAKLGATLQVDAAPATGSRRIVVRMNRISVFIVRFPSKARRQEMRAMALVG